MDLFQECKIGLELKKKSINMIHHYLKGKPSDKI